MTQKKTSTKPQHGPRGTKVDATRAELERSARAHHEATGHRDGIAARRDEAQQALAAAKEARRAAEAQLRLSERSVKTAKKAVASLQEQLKIAGKLAARSGKEAEAAEERHTGVLRKEAKRTARSAPSPEGSRSKDRPGRRNGPPVGAGDDAQAATPPVAPSGVASGGQVETPSAQQPVTSEASVSSDALVGPGSGEVATETSDSTDTSSTPRTRRSSRRTTTPRTTTPRATTPRARATSPARTRAPRAAASSRAAADAPAPTDQPTPADAPAPPRTDAGDGPAEATDSAQS